MQDGVGGGWCKTGWAVGGARRGGWWVVQDGVGGGWCKTGWVVGGARRGGWWVVDEGVIKVGGDWVRDLRGGGGMSATVLLNEVQ